MKFNKVKKWLATNKKESNNTTSSNNTSSSNSSSSTTAHTCNWVSSTVVTKEAHAKYLLVDCGLSDQYVSEKREAVTGTTTINVPAETKTVYTCSGCGKTK